MIIAIIVIFMLGGVALLIYAITSLHKYRIVLRSPFMEYKVVSENNKGRSENYGMNSCMLDNGKGNVVEYVFHKNVYAGDVFHLCKYKDYYIEKQNISKIKPKMVYWIGTFFFLFTSIVLMLVSLFAKETKDDLYGIIFVFFIGIIFVFFIGIIFVFFIGIIFVFIGLMEIRSFSETISQDSNIYMATVSKYLQQNGIDYDLGICMFVNFVFKGESREIMALDNTTKSYRKKYPVGSQIQIHFDEKDQFHNNLIVNNKAHLEFHKEALGPLLIGIGLIVLGIFLLYAKRLIF